MHFSKLAFFVLLRITLHDIINPIELQPVFINSPSSTARTSVDKIENKAMTVTQTTSSSGTVVTISSKQETSRALPGSLDNVQLRDNGGGNTGQGQLTEDDGTSATGKINSFGSCPTSAYKIGVQPGQLGQPAKIVKKYEDYLSQFKPKNSAFQKTINLQASPRAALLKSGSNMPQIYAYRELVFNKNVDTINAHNSALSRKFNMDLNQFSDLSPSQFTSKYATLIVPSQLLNLPKVETANVPPIQVPVTVSQPTQSQIQVTNNRKVSSSTSSYTPPFYVPASSGTLTYTITSSETSSPIVIKQSSSILITHLPTNTLEIIPTPTPTPNPNPNPNPKPNPNTVSISLSTTSTTSTTSTLYTATTNRLSPPRTLTQLSSTTLPNQIIDWRCKSVSTVYAQGQCGSCYAIASLDALFISLNIKKPELLPYSIQEILSCAKNDRTLFGCRGGYFQDVYTYVQKYGIGYASMYPYSIQARSQGKNITCNTTKILSPSYSNYKKFIRGSYRISSGDCIQLIQILKQQAVAVAISTDGNLQFYSNGTFIPLIVIGATNSNRNVNHGVTLVGYNINDGFLIKNSWGNLWGMGGYGYVGKETGICDFAVAPII